MNKWLSPRFQRVLGIYALLLVQLAAFVVVLTQFNSYFVYFYWACLTLSIFVCIWIASTKTRLPYKMAWIIPILTVPILGVPAYFLFGGARRSKEEQRQRSWEILREQLHGAARPSDLRAFGVDVVQQSQYLLNAACCPPYGKTDTTYFPTGEAFYPVFLQELSNAKQYIFLEYFIIAEGRMWSDILSILAQKAAQGVDVRVIYDAMGSVVTLPHSFPEDLDALGIQCSAFQPVRPILSIQHNNRNHRKLCVIDGIAGFVGGINLADEYINQIKRFGYWKDSAMLLRGEAVWSMTVMFLQMWGVIRRTDIDYSKFRPRAYPTVSGECGFVQPYADTPLAEDTVCADLHIQMFSKAKWYLYITTPYLVIDDTIATALYITARSGVDVRIMVPHIPDKKLVFSVTQSHYEALLQAGVRIYEYIPGFIHSKTVVADDLYASVGSCNMDYRSFYLQHENGVWLCGCPSVSALREDFLVSLSHCKEITLRDCMNIPLPKRLIRSLLRIFSPLL